MKALMKTTKPATPATVEKKWVLIDAEGLVVGVLVAGGGQNINFAVPIARLCGSLRDC